MKFILVFLGLIFYGSANAQNIAIYNAYINEKPLVNTSVIGYRTYWGHEPNVVFELSYDLHKKGKAGIRYFYDDYFGFVGFGWMPSDKNISQTGQGYGGTKMTRFGLFGDYRITQLCDKLLISGRVYLDYQSYNSQFGESGIKSKVGDIRLESSIYSGPDRGETFLTTYDKWQLLPSIGLSLSYRPFWKVILHAEAFYSHGFVAHSRLEFEYTDLEVEQPTGEFIGNGTSFTYAFGLGFRLWE